MQQQDISAYRSLSDIEHVREATDMYLGDFATKSQDKYVLVDNKFVLTKMVCNDAVMKLISEGLDNSVDNSYRDPPTTAIRFPSSTRRPKSSVDMSLVCRLSPPKASSPSISGLLGAHAKEA